VGNLDAAQVLLTRGIEVNAKEAVRADVFARGRMLRRARFVGGEANSAARGL